MLKVKYLVSSLLVSVLASLPANAQSFSQSELTLVRDVSPHAVSTTTPEEMIGLGYATCSALDNGISVDTLYTIHIGRIARALKDGISHEGVSKLNRYYSASLASSVVNLCPHHRQQIIDFINTEYRRGSQR